VEVTLGEVEVETLAPEGFLVVEDGGVTVALDTRITEELAREGTLRELVHRLQNLRKDQGLEVTDRVRVTLGARDGFRDLVEQHRGFIASELLAESLEIGAPEDGIEPWVVEGEAVTVRLEKH